MTTTVRVDEKYRDLLNEIVEHYDNEWEGEASQRIIMNKLIREEHERLFEEGEDVHSRKKQAG